MTGMLILNIVLGQMVCGVLLAVILFALRSLNDDEDGGEQDSGDDWRRRRPRPGPPRPPRPLEPSNEWSGAWWSARGPPRPPTVFGPLLRDYPAARQRLSSERNHDGTSSKDVR